MLALFNLFIYLIRQRYPGLPGVLLGSFRKYGLWFEAMHFFGLFFCSAYLGILCGGPYSHHAKYDSFMFMHKISTRVVCVNVSLFSFHVFFFCSAYLGILCGGPYSHHAKYDSFMFMHKISTRVVCVNVSLFSFHVFLLFMFFAVVS